MKKLLLQLQGYIQIDEVDADWEITQYNLQGETISTVEYSKYYIFYNYKKDHYKMLVGGFRPYQNAMHVELSSMLNFLNKKPITSLMTFWEDSQDYFIQKSKLNDLIKESYNSNLFEPSEINSSDILDRVRVVKLDLSNYKEHLDKIKQEDPRLIKAMQDFKKNVLSKNEKVDIWQDLGNVIITSEGCYFSIYHKNLKFEEGTDEEQ